MKKFMQQPGGIVDDMLLGAVCASRGLSILAGQRVVVRSDYELLKASHHVALISGGGAGHEPAHAGYVGPGLLTAAVCGEVFTSPSTDAVLSAIRAVGGPAGVLLIVKNYTGDRLNFGLAAEIARSEGIRVEMLVVADDAAIADAAATAGKRGIAGTVLIHKIAGAAAAEGKSLDEVLEISRTAADGLATMGVALSSCTVPAAGKPSFSLGDDEIEFGLGIHGEPGVERTKIIPVDAIVERIFSSVVPSGPLSAPIALLVNNLGGTSSMEIAVVVKEVLDQAQRRSVTVKRIWFGTFLTALEMAGMSISALRLDDEVLRYLDAPADAFAWPGQGVEPRYDVICSELQSIPNGDTKGVGSSSAESAVMKDVVLGIAGQLVRSEDSLTELDRKVGDGDLGINLARGARIISEKIGDLDGKDHAGAFRWLSGIVRSNVGGTSGALYAIGLMRAANAIDHKGANSFEAFRDALRAAADGISELGGAKLGDRTMLDALIPAAEAFAAGGPAAREALRHAVEAARVGAERSAQISSRKGRSSYIGDRVIGHRDPGAEAVVLWLQAIDEMLRTADANSSAGRGASATH